MMNYIPHASVSNPSHPLSFIHLFILLATSPQAYSHLYAHQFLDCSYQPSSILPSHSIVTLFPPPKFFQKWDLAILKMSDVFISNWPPMTHLLARLYLSLELGFFELCLPKTIWALLSPAFAYNLRCRAHEGAAMLFMVSDCCVF